MLALLETVKPDAIPQDEDMRLPVLPTAHVVASLAPASAARRHVIMRRRFSHPAASHRGKLSSARVRQLRT